MTIRRIKSSLFATQLYSQSDICNPLSLLAHNRITDMRLFSRKADTAEIFSVYLLFPKNHNTVLLIICQLQLVKNIEYKAQCHSDHTGQDHTCKLYISKLQGNS